MGNTFDQHSVSGAAHSKGGTRANMPANNITGKHTSVSASKRGSGMHNSQFAKTASAGGSGGGSGKQNLPTKNKGNTSVPLGTTHHAVGEVPAYLKRKTN